MPQVNRVAIWVATRAAVVIQVAQVATQAAGVMAVVAVMVAAGVEIKKHPLDKNENCATLFTL